ncbi:MAG: D-alanine--D-alanine ligase family protein [Planctomycetota bacterium]|jgi:D-alanine--D-alanine ligase
MPKELSQLKVAVLAGGISSEREVSLLSGQTIYDALVAAGVETVMSDISPDDLSILDDASIDVFFPILHGTFGEDGQLQEIMQDRNLCFVGPDAESSRKSFDKLRTKQACFHAKLPVAKHLIVQTGDTEPELADMLGRLAKKYVIKPVNQGSSVGVEITDDVKAAAAKAIECFAKYGNCMVEEFVPGREITVGIVNGTPLPIVEIRSKAGFYDYHSKYIDDATEYLFDTIDDEELVMEIQQDAVTCFNELGCRHLSRVDFILTDLGIPYVLEINTLPGFTSHSLLPMAANKAGTETPQLCRQLVEAAWNDYNNNANIK